MATFPTLVPSAAPIAPGAWPSTAHSSLNGAESRVRHGSAEIGRRLALTFTNITEADFLAILTHYRGQRSGFDSFGFDTTTLAADLTPAGFAWVYTSRPQVVDDHADCFTVSCEFRCEPRGLAVAPGKVWRSLTTFVSGVSVAPRWVTTETTLTPGLGLMPVAVTWGAGVANITYSNSNATATAASTGGKTVKTVAKSSGKWYAEISASLLFSAPGSSSNVDSQWGVSSTSGTIWIRHATNAFQDSGIGATLSGTGMSYANGAARILMVAIDFDAKKLWFGVDGSWLDGSNPATGNNPTASAWTGSLSWSVFFSPYWSGDAGTLQGMPNYPVPAGFSRWAD